MKRINKFDRDAAIVTAILDRKENLSDSDRKTLLAIFQPSYHDSGKIEGITSIDGSAIHCEFCQSMKKAAEKDPAMVCGDCYITSLDKLYNGMTARHWLNQLILSEVEYSVKELSEIYIASKYVRIHADGDFRNAVEAVNVLRFAKGHKANNVTIWFKNLSAMKEAIAKEGKPKNVFIIYSACRLNENPIDIIKKYPWIDYVFTVYVDKASTKKAIADGANECNGKKCKACGYKCYNGGWKKGTNIAEYLRGVNPEKRKEKIEAVKARQNKQ